MQISKQNDKQTNKILRSQAPKRDICYTIVELRKGGGAGDCDLGQPNALA